MGALILGEAAVNAGLVSPIMIIVIAITSISALVFSELEMINGLRWYRLLFMLGALFLGIYGVVMVFIYFVVKFCSLLSFGIPYSSPFSPTDMAGIKNSIIKLPTKLLDKRRQYLTSNRVKLRDNE